MSETFCSYNVQVRERDVAPPGAHSLLRFRYPNTTIRSVYITKFVTMITIPMYLTYILEHSEFISFGS
jgi:hypothetical protein